MSGTPFHICIMAITRLTAGVTRLGWEDGVALETENAQSQEHAKKRGAYPKSGARFVGQKGLSEAVNN